MTSHNKVRQAHGTMTARLGWCLGRPWRVLSRSWTLLGASVAAVLFTATPALATYAYIPDALLDTVSVLDATTNTVIETLPGFSRPYGVAVSPDGSRVYVANYYGSSVSVIDGTMSPPSVIATISVDSNPYAVAVSPDGKRVYVAHAPFAGGSGSVSVIDTTFIGTQQNPAIATISVDGAAYGVAVSPDGSKVYVSWGNDSVSVIDTSMNTVSSTISGFDDPYGVAVSPDGSRVYVANYADGTSGTVVVGVTAVTQSGVVTEPSVSVIDATASPPSVIATIDVGTRPFGVAVSPDGSRVYVANEGSDNVAVIDTTKSLPVIAAVVGVGTSPDGLAVTPDGAKVYVANAGGIMNPGNLSVIDTKMNTVSATIGGFQYPSAYGVFIGPSPLAASDSCDGTFNGTFAGSVTVSAGQNCTFISGSEITGSVAANGGSLKLAGKVDNNVLVSGATSLSLVPGVTIGGNLEIEGLTPGLPQSTVCGVMVNGNLWADSNASPLAIGSISADCTGNTVGGNLKADYNSADMAVDSNVIPGNAQIDGNTGTTDVSGNSIGKNLECLDNAEVSYLDSSPNQVGGNASGQCAVR